MKVLRIHRSLVVAFALAFFCVGCIRFSTPEERRATFAPYREIKIGQDSLGDYLLARSAVLLRADQIDPSQTNSNSLRLRITKTNTLRTTSAMTFGLGTASAVDRRGYFLTAAHCVEDAPVWLVLVKDDKMQVKRARTVWRGNVKKGEPDLAVLSIASPLEQIFEWAKEYTNGIPVGDLGMTFHYQAPNLEVQCMAGKLLKISERAEDTAPHYTIISHDSPLHRGDSGGPLVLPDGRLLGINVSIQSRFKWKHFQIEQSLSRAHRPDLAWLKEIINNDAGLESKPL